jgi:hypothetical protein
MPENGVAKNPRVNDWEAIVDHMVEHMLKPGSRYQVAGIRIKAITPRFALRASRVVRNCEEALQGEPRTPLASPSGEPSGPDGKEGVGREFDII